MGGADSSIKVTFLLQPTIAIIHINLHIINNTRSCPLINLSISHTFNLYYKSIENLIPIYDSIIFMGLVFKFKTEF